MIGKKIWRKYFLAVLIGGMLLVNPANVLAVPMELSLTDSIALALKNSPSVKMAEDDKATSKWALAEAKAKFGPSLTFSHTATRSGYPVFTLEQYLSGSSFAGLTGSLGGEYNSFGNTMSVSVPLYTGGNLEGQFEQAKKNLQVADLEGDKNKQQIKLDTTIAYFNVLEALDQLEMNEESLTNLTAHLKSVQAQYDEGVVNKSDVLRSEVEVINAQQDIMTTKNNYNLAMVSLKNVMSLPLTSEIKLKDYLNYQKYTFALDDCVTYALEHRPDIIQVQAKIDIAKSGVKVAKSNNLPQVSFTGSNKWNDDKFPGAKQDYWMVSLTASINVFDSGLTKAKVKGAESSLDKAQEGVEQIRETVALEVSQAYLNLKVAQERILTSKNAVDKAQEAFRINEVCYKEGVGRNLDVIDAQLALVKAKTNYNQALYDYNSNKAKLDKAMGN
jgi:outer membrane protein